jgi:hypothetical protein
LFILVVGIVAGILFDRLAGPSWLARQFAGLTRSIITSALVGVAGAFVGYHVAVLLALGGGLVTSVIAAAAGAAVRHAANNRKQRGLGKPETFNFLGMGRITTSCSTAMASYGPAE